MVGKTTDDRILEFNFGDIIVTNEKNKFCMLYSFSNSIFTFLTFNIGGGTLETFKARPTELPQSFQHVIRGHSLIKQKTEPNLQKLQEELGLPDITKVFPKEERIDFQEEDVTVNTEQVLNSLSKATLLIGYLETILDKLIGTPTPNETTEPAMSSGSISYIENYISPSDNAFIRIATDAIPSRPKAPSPKETAKRTRASRFGTTLSSDPESTSV